MTLQEFEAIGKALGPVVHAIVAKAHEGLVAQVGTLKRELDAANERVSDLNRTIQQQLVMTVGDMQKAAQMAQEPLWLENRRLEMRILELETRPPTTITIPGVPGPQGEPGVPGAPGPRGEKGLDGIGVQGGSGPQGQQGDRGDVGMMGPAGPQGEKGAEGPPGRDGRDGLVGERGSQGAAGAHGDTGQIGPIGPRGDRGEKGDTGLHGKDGADGLSIDDADLVFDPERGVILRIAVGGRVKDFVLPSPFYVGNWKAGERYPKGAEVRHGGHVWLALTQTAAMPGEGHPDWQLLVSRGKEGRPGKDGAPGMDPLELQRWVEKVNR